MSDARTYRTFVHKEAVFRICCACFEAVTDEIVLQRRVLETYIAGHPEFWRSFIPVKVKPTAPLVAQRMAEAAERVGVGPMAAVAGVMAQLAAEAGLKAGAEEAIVDNGGDIYVQAAGPVTIGLFAGGSRDINHLAFALRPEDTPVAICSSSGTMGHSMSLGRCDLATVVAKDAGLADAAATQAANLVRKCEDVEGVLNWIEGLDGVDGILVVKDGTVGLAGKLPALCRTKEIP